MMSRFATNVARYGHCFLWMKLFDVMCHPRLGREPTATLGALVLRLLVLLHMPRQVRARVERIRALIARESSIILVQLVSFLRFSSKLIT